MASANGHVDERHHEEPQGPVVFHVGGVEEGRRADQHEGAGAADPEEIGHALEGKERHGGEADEEVVAVLPEVSLGEVQDIVEEPGGAGAEDDVAGRGGPRERLDRRLHPGEVEQERQAEGEQDEAGDERGGKERHGG